MSIFECFLGSGWRGCSWKSAEYLIVLQMEKIRIAFIGAGYRGQQLMRLLREIPSFVLTGVADPHPREEPEEGIRCYRQGAEAYRQMLDECRPQLVFVTSPWQCHVEHALRCIEAGSDVAIEIKGGLRMGEYTQLAEKAAQCGRRIFPLENTLFMREVLAMYNLVQAGELGEIVHMRGGYRHDLRELLLDDHGRLGGRQGTESVWRSRFYMETNADIYPTHGLAPLCLIAGIGRKERLVRLTAFASKAAGLHHRMAQLGATCDVPITMGDVVVTQLESENGILMTLTHDTTLPRPRSLDFEVQGTRGIWQGDRRLIYLEGRSPRETWESDHAYLQPYEHDYWKWWGEEALRYDSHHQGMDYIMLKAVEADRLHIAPYPADVYDLALWTSVTPLSGLSIAEHRTVALTEFP
mgnify:FL=1